MTNWRIIRTGTDIHEVKILKQEFELVKGWEFGHIIRLGIRIGTWVILTGIRHILQGTA